MTVSRHVLLEESCVNLALLHSVTHQIHSISLHVVAGATLMAAGASSPELFSSIVALFITHSALGLGTIVGSEIFNQLCICAGAVFAAKSGKLELDRAILIREVGFYALGIALFGYALRDTRPDPEDDGQLHIYISFGESVLVFGGYVLYVLVCANMDTIVDFCEALSYACKRASRRGQQAQQQLDGATMSTYGALSLTASEHEYSKRASFQLEDMPFLREARLCKEPSSNFVTFYRTQTGEKAYRTRTSQGESSEDHTFTKSIASSIRRAIGTYSDGAALRGFDFLVHSQRPSNERSVYDMEVNTVSPTSCYFLRMLVCSHWSLIQQLFLQFEDRLSCFMWQQSYFYSNARYSTKAWHLRWFTLTPSHLYSVPDRAESHKYRVKYPPFQEIEVDEKRLILRLINPEEGKRDFYLLAPSMEILEAFVMKMEAIIDYHKTTPDDGVTAAMESTRDEEYGSEGGGDNAKLIDFPFGGSAFEIVFFCILFPLRFILHWTVPDVRTFDEHGNPTATLGKAFAAIGVCLIWLVVGSYAMVASLESLAALMDIPDAVVGVTVSAAGTSLPNYVASKVAAQNGFGVSQFRVSLACCFLLLQHS